MTSAEDPKRRIPNDDCDSAVGGGWLNMVWRGRHSTKPRLLDIKIHGRSEDHEQMERMLLALILERLNDREPRGRHVDEDPLTYRGRHADYGAVEVGMDVPSKRVIYENIEPLPDGTPVAIGGLKVVQKFGCWWDVP